MSDEPREVSLNCAITIEEHMKFPYHIEIKQDIDEGKYKVSIGWFKYSFLFFVKMVQVWFAVHRLYNGKQYKANKLSIIQLLCR